MKRKTSGKEYPYQNLSLEDIEGEAWEDIPGLDGRYAISNLGRIKRQRHEAADKNGVIRVRNEKMMKLKVAKTYNRFKDDYTYFLLGKVVIQNRDIAFSVARMVYYCFVEPFDLSDNTRVVICRNTDNFDIRPSNLLLSALDHKQHRMVARERFRSSLLDRSEEEIAANQQWIIKTRSKPVTQSTLNRRKIKTYSSISEASRVTGVTANSIGEAASGEYITAGGFTWSWNEEAKLDAEGTRQERRTAYMERKGQKVTQYDLSGKKIEQYASVRDATEASGATKSGINMALRGVSKSCKGFLWKKGYGESFIDLSNYQAGSSRAVEQYTLRIHSHLPEG